MGGGPESRYVGRVCGADVAVRHHEEDARSNNPEDLPYLLIYLLT